MTWDMRTWNACTELAVQEKRTILLVILTLVAIVALGAGARALWAFPATYPCPYDGANATFREVKPVGTGYACQFTHWAGNRDHTFWVPCE